jgi:adenylate kinase family enzyme
LTGLPVIELDKNFWSAELRPASPEAWTHKQRELAAADQWIIDGDLGPYDVLAPRLARADTVLIFDFSLLRCAWRALRRSRERADFWRWMFTWRRGRTALLAAIAEHAPSATVHVVRSPDDVRRLLS